MNKPMMPTERRTLQAIASELGRLQFEAGTLRREYLAFLIGSAADEARDQLRDDALMRRDLDSAKADTDQRGAGSP